MRKVAALLFILTILILSAPSGSYAIEEDLAISEKAADRKPAGEVSAESDEDFDEDFDIDLEGEDELVVPDPLEGFNRAMFWFNDKFYFYLFKPTTRVYRFILPEPVRVSVGNFFGNLRTPISFVNSLLQFKFKDAGNELLRFVMNSTIGIAGLFDPAYTLADIKPKKEDFDQTLGVWGFGQGDYFILPILGPAGTRNSIGRIVDIFFYPVTYISASLGEFIAIRAVEGVNDLSLDRDTYEAIKKQSLDPYIFIRDSYYQRREGLVKK